MANVLTTEVVILIVCGICLTIVGISYESALPILFIVGLLFPVLFYHHSWSLWLGFDYLVEGLPKYDGPDLK